MSKLVDCPQHAFLYTQARSLTLVGFVEYSLTVISYSLSCESSYEELNCKWAAEQTPHALWILVPLRKLHGQQRTGLGSTTLHYLAVRQAMVSVFRAYIRK